MTDDEIVLTEADFITITDADMRMLDFVMSVQTVDIDYAGVYDEDDS